MSDSAGSSMGDKVKGAFEAVHGIGETIRTSALDFMDTCTGTAGQPRRSDANSSDDDGFTRTRQNKPAADVAPTTPPMAAAEPAVVAGNSMQQPQQPQQSEVAGPSSGAMGWTGPGMGSGSTGSGSTATSWTSPGPEKASRA